MGSQSGGKAAGCTTADTGLSLPRWQRAGRGPQPETPKPEEHSCVAHVKKRWLLFRTQVGVLTSQSISKLKLFNLLFFNIKFPTYIYNDGHHESPQKHEVKTALLPSGGWPRYRPPLRCVIIPFHTRSINFFDNKCQIVAWPNLRSVLLPSRDSKRRPLWLQATHR